MKLIVINGPCGVGKSTLAKKLHEFIPLCFLIDIDLIRRHISGHQKHKEESRHLAHLVTLAILDVCFKEGRDVVLDKMLHDPLMIDAYRAVADEYHAEIFEFLLWASKDIVMARANDRGWINGGLLTPEKCEMFWEKTNVLKETRSKAIVIDTSVIGEDEVFQKVKVMISADLVL